jgi:Helix-turn-helix domain
MKPEPQKMILEMLRTGRQIKSREFIRDCQGWDHRKAISRLRRQGWNIHSEIRPGEHEATYQLLPHFTKQMGLL